MPRDPTNMPFERLATYLSEEATAADASFAPKAPTEATPQAGDVAPGDDVDDVVDLRLKAESILLEEFNYASVVAYQAKEDSANLFNLYLLAVGAMATGLGVLVSAATHTTQLQVTLIAMLALMIFTILSFAFFAKFFDLGQDYREALLAMSVVKEYYIQRLKRAAPEIEQAFRWRLRRVPRSGPIGGGGSLISVVIALLGGVSFGGGFGEVRQLWSIVANQPVSYSAEISVGGYGVPFFWEILAGLLIALLHLTYYLVAIRQRDARHLAEARQEARKFQLPRLGASRATPRSAGGDANPR